MSCRSSQYVQYTECLSRPCEAEPHPPYSELATASVKLQSVKPKFHQSDPTRRCLRPVSQTRVADKSGRVTDKSIWVTDYSLQTFSFFFSFFRVADLSVQSRHVKIFCQVADPTRSKENFIVKFVTYLNCDVIKTSF